MLYSYHIFHFPFKWDVLGQNNSSSFSERIDLNSIKLNAYSPWEHSYRNQKETDYLLYNEKNYFYTFIHPLLYDTGQANTIIKHYERSEVKNGTVKYNIHIVAGAVQTYALDADDIVINLYSTGVGVLVFYLKNELYENPEDILRINQFGRRIFPPFLGYGNYVGASKNIELADSISITGLNGPAVRYFEDFTGYTTSDKVWKPACFIQALILDLSEDFVIIPYEAKRNTSLSQLNEIEKGVMPAVDDRMFVSSIIFNNQLKEKIATDNLWYLSGDKALWSRFMFVDTSNSCIQNREMSDRLLKENTYLRWQEYGTIYGFSKYSFVAISDPFFGIDVLLPQYKTMYARMVELALIQRASVLKFSGEVTRLSNLGGHDNQLVGKIGDLYKEYIRFVNQIYFREVTAQEQGIDIYQRLQQQINIEKQVESLDSEIEELHQYAILLEDRTQNKKLAFLTKMGAMFLIPSLLVGYFGMNIFELERGKSLTLSGYFLGAVLLIIFLCYSFFTCKNKTWQLVALISSVVVVLSVLALTFLICVGKS